MNNDDLVFAVIKPALQAIGHYDAASVALLAGTCAAESSVGAYLLQGTYSPGENLNTFTGGLGLFQMQRDDHDDIVKNYLAYHSELEATLQKIHGDFNATYLITDLLYSAGFCRVHYLRNNEPLPHWNDTLGLANYWKTHYNSSLGAGDNMHFMNSFNLVQSSVSKIIAMEKLG